MPLVHVDEVEIPSSPADDHQLLAVNEALNKSAALEPSKAELVKPLQARREAQASEQQAVEAGQRARAGEQEAQRSAAQARPTVYVIDVALAHQAADQGNAARAGNLLDLYRPKADEEDVRGFEWRYLCTRARSDETARLGEYSGGLRELALSPDANYPASRTARGVEIRSFKDQALIGRVAEPYLKLVGLRIEPRTHASHDQGDGYGIRTFIAGVSLVDVATRATRRLELPAGCGIDSMSWSPDGKRFVVENSASDHVINYRRRMAPPAGRSRASPDNPLHIDSLTVYCAAWRRTSW